MLQITSSKMGVFNGFLGILDVDMHLRCFKSYFGSFGHIHALVMFKSTYFLNVAF